MYMYSYSNCDDKRNNKQSLKCLGVIAYLARIRTITCIPKSYYVGIVASQLLVQLFCDYTYKAFYAFIRSLNKAHPLQLFEP